MCLLPIVPISRVFWLVTGGFNLSSVFSCFRISELRRSVIMFQFLFMQSMHLFSASAMFSETYPYMLFCRNCFFTVYESVAPHFQLGYAAVRMGSFAPLLTDKILRCCDVGCSCLRRQADSCTSRRSDSISTAWQLHNGMKSQNQTRVANKCVNIGV